MISSSALYWVLKLDDFRDLLTVTMGISTALATVCAVVTLFAFCERDDECRKACHAGCRRYGMASAWAMAAACLLRALLPSTGQAAVLWAAPAVLNSRFVSEEVPAEARELYGLAKKWLEAKAGAKAEIKTEKEGKGDTP